ncbi:MAG: DRTGG domain-containing protein [Acidobacteriota bacterium]|jgi:predicted transcriptional regulator
MPTPVKQETLSLAEIRDLLGAEVFYGEDLSVKVGEVGAADLMSDVLNLGKPGMLLLTGLASAQMIRTAAVAGLCGVVLVRGKRPDKSVLALARERKIPILGAPLTMFETAGLIYMALAGR